MGILVDPIKYFPSHPSEDTLEEYVFHRLPEELTAPLEEHLLVCHICQDAVAKTDEFVAAMKVGADQPALPQASQPAQWSGILPRLASRTILAPAVALVLLALVVVWKHPQEASAPVAVSLSSMRGSNDLSTAPAEKPLDLSLEAPDLAPGKEYSLEVVDAAGHQVWRGAVAAVGGKLTATMPEPLRNGVYWVRLYGADSGLLREFGLSAK